jgi:thermitase
MKRFNYIIALLSVALLSGAANPRKMKAYKEGELLVKFHVNTHRANERHFLTRNSDRVQKIRDLDSEGLTHIKLAPGQTVEEAMKEFAQDPEVESVQPNFIYHVTAAPNDTNYASQWALKNTGQNIATGTYGTNNPGTAGKDLNAEGAWNLITDCSSVPVAVLDTGVNYNQQDLVANMWNGGVAFPNHGYDFVDSDNDPMDFHGHGTHVAGIIGGAGNDATGTTGLCWNANIMAVRVLDATGSGTTANIISGLNFAVAHGARVVNMSLGGSVFDATFNAALTTASNSGVVIVVAAGNNGSNNNQAGNAVYPCNYTTATLICVAALDQSYALATFSNYGVSSVDVGAPGTNILSTYHGTVISTTDDFTAGWNLDGIWTPHVVNLSGTNYDMLTNPAAWDGTGAVNYANGLDSRAYKNFNLFGFDSAVVSYYGFYDTESGADFFNTAFSAGGGDPFVAGTSLDSLSGSNGTTADSFAFSLAGCYTVTCTLGFQLTSNGAVNGDGVGLLLFQIDKLTLNATSYNTLNGTSMATPFVSGIAAMLFAYNTSYLAADVVQSIKTGGIQVGSLTGKTTTGSAASAYNTLIFVGPPTRGAVKFD